MKNYILLLLLIAQSAWAQTQFEAKVNKNSIGINERLRIDFTMNEDGDNFVPPAFDGFQIMMGPNQSVSYSWINGKKSFNKTYSYYLIPQKKGSFTIKSASIEIENKIYKTNPIKVTVGDAVKEEQDPYQRYNPFGNQPQQQQQQPQQTAEKLGEGVYLVANISNSNPYVNEPITVVYKLYVSPYVSVYGSKETATPKFNNFWSQFIEIKDFKPVPDTYNGEQYVSIEIRKVVLYPQQAGNLPLEPLKMEIELDMPTGRRDFFGRPEYKQGTRNIVAGAKSIKVKELPTENRPESFTGAVGVFDFKMLPSKTALKTGESLDLDVLVTGKGNMKLFSLPKPQVPTALEMFEPQHLEEITTPITGTQGRVTDKYTIVPNEEGKFVIKPLEFSYFDLATKQYKTITTQEVVLDVSLGDAVADQDNSGKTSKKKVKQKDAFAFIQNNAHFVDKAKDDFLGSLLFYILVGITVVGLPVVVLLRKKKTALDNDVVGNKIRKSDRLAKKYLAEAKKQLGNKVAFYEAMERALHNFLKAKLHIETSEMSVDHIKELLLEKQADASTIEQFISLKQNCEFARYTPSSNAEMQEDYNKAVEVITALQKQI